MHFFLILSLYKIQDLRTTIEKMQTFTMLRVDGALTRNTVIFSRFNGCLPARIVVR